MHFYTALGTVAAFLGTLAVIDGRYRTAFVWMIVATLVDATDGIFARMARVKELLPAFDGARLDDIVDYLTFVFLPVLLLYHAGHLPERWGILVASAVLVSSGYGFASSDAKTDDYFFTGFPSYWNIVALYLHAAAMPPLVNAAVVLFLVVMVFVRIGYIYPSRTPILQGLTIALGLVWGVMVVAIVQAMPSVPRPLLIGSLFFPVYYIVLSWFLHARRQRARS
ncbi:MAG: CDP-diacylglycerol O-phosphatidyltransferase [Acidobacteria bacterium]|nr:CDP-diacylglycerol O-phosphatidyltransferase [Acidobacteriota bacterium]